MSRIVARARDVPPGQVRGFEIRDEGVVPQGRSRFPLLRLIQAGRSRWQRIALANVASGFFAIDDTCTHAQCSLGDGRLAGSIVRCACHGSRFDVTSGAVVEGPAEMPVRTYATHHVGDEVQVDV